MKGYMGPGYPSYTICGWGMYNFFVFKELEPFSTTVCPSRQKPFLLSDLSWKSTDL